VKAGRVDQVDETRLTGLQRAYAICR